MTVLTLALLAGSQPAAPRLAPVHQIGPQSRRQSPHTPCAPLVRTDALFVTSAPLQPPQAIRRGQIPIAPAAPPLHHCPRFRALALFGRRPPERVERFVIAGSRK